MASSTALDKYLEILKFDMRLLGWNKRNGILTEADQKKHLEKLEDLSGNTLPVTLEDKGNSH